MIIYITSNIYRIKYSNILIRDNPTVVVCIAMYIMNSSNEGSKTAKKGHGHNITRQDISSVCSIRAQKFCAQK